MTGFEPAAPCTPCKCATRLRYIPLSKIIISKQGAAAPKFTSFTPARFAAYRKLHKISFALRLPVA